MKNISISQSISYNPVDSCNSSKLLSHDEACLQIFSTVSHVINVQVLEEECYKCGLSNWAPIHYGNSSFVLSTTYPTQYVYFLSDYTCTLRYPFKEDGIYGLNVTQDICNDIWIIQKPKNHYFPLIIALIAVILSTLLWKIVKWTWNSSFVISWRQSQSMRLHLENDLGNLTSPTAENELTHVSQNSRVRLNDRVRALDTLRGFCIAVMIFVNYGGGGYWIFEHSPWNGLTVADVVFPWFAWIMGVSTSLSLRSQLRNTTSRKKLFARITLRSSLLVLLGVALNTIGGYRNGLLDIRFLGVLQRLGIAYFIVASLEAVFMKPQRLIISGLCMHLEDILECWKQWIVVILIAVCHSCLTFMLKVPDCPAGYLGPGGMHDFGKYENCTGGAAGYIDRLVLGERHLYQHPTCQPIYNTSLPYDPEGLLGTMTTVLLVFLGVQAGRTLLTYGNSFSRIIRWCIWSFITGLIAGVLCNFSKEEGIIPVNKNLWSLSYVLSTASMAFLLLALLFYVVDVKGWWRGCPFYYAGLNSILLYVGHCLTKNMFPWFWEPFYNSHGELLIMNIWATLLWIIISYCLFHYSVYLSL